MDVQSAAASAEAAGKWLLEHPGAALLGGAGLVAAWYLVRPIHRWNLRRIPGPRTWPVLGNLPGLLAMGDLHDFVAHYCKQFTVWQLWVGAKPHVVVADLDVARKALTRFKARPDMDDMCIRHGEDRESWNAGLLFITGHKWRVARRAFEAGVMHPKSLSAQAPFVAQCAARLCARLERYASSGEPVDVLPLVYAMTLDAVGFAAFGLDLASTTALGAGGEVDGVATLQLAGPAGKGGKAVAPSSTGAAPVGSNPPPDGWWDAHPLGSPEFGMCLVECAVGVMKSMTTATSSTWGFLTLFFPWAEPLARVVSRVLQDKPMRMEKQHFKGLREACKVIIRTWRQRHQAQSNQAAAISEEGFIARLISGMEAGAAGAEDYVSMSDVDLVGNAIGMVVTGYETTGSSIATSLYYLARNPTAQTRLQQEVDLVVGGKEVTLEDLDNMPYLNAVFLETVRLRPPGNAAIRNVSDDWFDLGRGIRVPRGTYLFIPLLHWMIDPKVWGPTALDFLPERHIQPGNEDLAPTNPAAMMPFGLGSRSCVGLKFAQLEARMGLARLMQRFTFTPAIGVKDTQWKTSLAYSPDHCTLHVASRNA